jgi:hypothetical protein
MLTYVVHLATQAHCHHLLTSVSTSSPCWTGLQVLDRPNNGMKLLLELHCDGRLEENCPTLTQRLQVQLTLKCT